MGLRHDDRVDVVLEDLDSSELPRSVRWDRDPAGEVVVGRLQVEDLGIVQISTVGLRPITFICSKESETQTLGIAQISTVGLRPQLFRVRPGHCDVTLGIAQISTVGLRPSSAVGSSRSRLSISELPRSVRWIATRSCRRAPWPPRQSRLGIAQISTVGLRRKLTSSPA